MNTVTVTVDEALVDQAEAKMAALARLVNEQTSNADRIRAIVALSEMWDSIEHILRAAIDARQEAYEVAEKTKDVKAMARIARDKKLETAVATYRTRSARYFGELIMSEAPRR